MSALDYAVTGTNNPRKQVSVDAWNAVLAEIDSKGEDLVRPESFGNDTDAFSAAVALASSNGKPIELDGSKTYSLGSASWVGLTVANQERLVINGNGATLALTHLPTQTDVASGSVVSWLKVTNTPLELRNIKFDLGGLAAVAINADQCRVIIDNCEGFNGASGSTSYFFRGHRCSGLITRCQAHDIGYFAYVGHTNANMHSDGLHLAFNESWDLTADHLVGVWKNGSCVGDTVNGCFSGIALAAYDATAAFCENLSIRDFICINPDASAIQSDIIGPTAVRHRNITIDGVSAVAGDRWTNEAAALSIYNIQGGGARNIRVEGFDYAVDLPHCQDFVVEGVDWEMTTAFAAAPVGVRIHPNTGGYETSNVKIRDVRTVLIATARAVSLNPKATAGDGIDKAVIEGVFSTGAGAGGVAVLTEYLTNSRIADCKLSGATTDLRVSSQDVILENNKYTTQSLAYFWQLTDPGTSVSLKGRVLYKLTNSVAASPLTALTDMIPGKHYTIIFTDGNTLVTNGALFILKGAVNVTPTANQMMTFVSDGSIVREVSRSF